MESSTWYISIREEENDQKHNHTGVPGRHLMAFSMLLSSMYKNTCANPRKPEHGVIGMRRIMQKRCSSNTSEYGEQNGLSHLESFALREPESKKELSDGSIRMQIDSVHLGVMPLLSRR